MCMLKQRSVMSKLSQVGVRTSLLSSLFLGLVLCVSGSSCTRVEPQPTTEQQADRDEAILKNYMAVQNITNFTKTEGGTYVVIDSAAAATEPTLREGQVVFVRYRGYTPTKATPAFDSNTVAPTSFRVNLGTSGGVIAGWREGLRKFKNKERGRLLVPSGQAYGNTATSTFGANQVLIFDIKIANAQ
jgi:FKBP-type peptidyl-prolyl cis-trans isomerase